MFTSPTQAPSDRRATLALRLTPLLTLTVFALVGLDVLLFETAVATALAAAVWVVYELHDYQRALDEHQLQTMQQQPLWPALQSHDSAHRAPESLLADSRFG